MALSKAFLLSVAVGAICAAYSGMATADMLQKVGPGEGAVNIIAWAGYIENGSDDKNYDWVTPFEKKTGCKVSVKIAGTSCRLAVRCENSPDSIPFRTSSLGT